MSGLLSNSLFLSTAAGGGAGYQIERSLRFNSSDSAFLSRTPAVAGNRTKWTWAAWVKIASFARTHFLFGAENTFAAFNSNGTSSDCELYFNLRGSSTNYFVSYAPKLRDPSAWYHLVFAVDTTQGTPANRLKVYINGVQATAAGGLGQSFPPQNDNLSVNNTVAHTICGSYYFDGYLADIHFIDGQALDATAFTEVSATTGQLIPKAYAGTYTGNSFWLKFNDNSAATATTLGKDSFLLGNNWTPNNLTATAFSYTSGSTQTGIVANASGSGGWAQAFDGSTSTLVYSTSGTCTITLAAGVPFTQIRVYAGQNTTAGTNILVNGVNLSPLYSWPLGGGWQDVTASLTSPFTSLGLVNVGGSSSNIRAVEINGTVLVDGNLSNIDSLVDTPTSYGTDTGVGGEVRGNYATWNPLDTALIGGTNTSEILSNGNLDMAGSGNDNIFNLATIGVTSGLKAYWEVTATVALNDWCISGILSNNKTFGDTIAALASGEIMIFAVDGDTGNYWFGRNGTWLTGNPATGTSPRGTRANTTIFPAARTFGTTVRHSANFGQRAFAYTAPSGFKALCDTNLAEGTITTSGSYTGNGVADGPFVYLNGVPTAMTVGGNAVTFGTHADKLSNGFKLRTTSTTYNQNALSYNYSITTTGAKFKFARAQPNP